MKIRLNTPWKCVISMWIGVMIPAITYIVSPIFGFWGAWIPTCVAAWIVVYYIAVVPEPEIEDDLEKS